MSTDPNGEDTPQRELADVLARELGPSQERGFRHASLRLQPTVLPPPPQEGGPPEPWPEETVGSVSADDDIDLGLDDGALRRRQLLLAAAGIGIAAIGGAAWLLFGQPGGTPPRAGIPTIQGDPSSPKAPPALPPTTEPTVETAVRPVDGGASMGAVSNDLVPPATEGLSPARKVNATRIIVENDREVPAPR